MPVEQEKRRTIEVDAERYEQFQRYFDMMHEVFPGGIPTPEKYNGVGRFWRDTGTKIIAGAVLLLIGVVIALGQLIPSEREQNEWRLTSKEFVEFRAAKTAEMLEISRGIERLEDGLKDLKRSLRKEQHQ